MRGPAREIHVFWRDVAELVKLSGGIVAVTLMNGITYELLEAEVKDLIVLGQVMITRYHSG